MLRRSAPSLLPLVALVVAGCTTGTAPDGTDDFDGPGVEITAAALNLEGVGDVVWDLEVVNGATTPSTVWQRRVTSSGYGDSAGSASYVGPCDADAAANPNTVRVWVVGVYDADVATADAGAFASGDATGVTGTALPFQNPTAPGAAGALTRTFTCVEGTDVAVQFDVALMRPAQQGFFDIAVNFNDIYCSAKLDCCDDADASGTCATPDEDIALLFDDTGARARTFVLGFACTAGTGAGVDTTLYMDALAFDCSDPGSGFGADFTVSPAGLAGNQCTAGDMAGCAAVTQVTAVPADDYLYQVAIFRGEELLQSGGVTANKVYWNLALGVKAAVSACELRTRATADDANDDFDGVVDGVIAAGAVYPYVTWGANLGSCAEEPLSFDGTTDVQTAYTATGEAAAAMGYGFAPGLPAAPVCVPACDNGGTCIAPNTCDCPAGWGGDHCQTVTVGTSCKALLAAGVTTSGLYTLDPDDTGPLAPFQAWCDMETDGGGWTMCWTSGGQVHMRSEITYNASFPYGTAGYRSDCRNIPFTDVLYVNEGNGQQAWFTKDDGVPIIAGTTSADWNRNLNATFTGHGVTTTAYKYQLNICDEVWMQVALFVTGYTGACWKACNNWCGDTSTVYYRPDGDYNPNNGTYHGLAFNENGHTNVSYKVLSSGIR
ncbi:MAG: hypothetical protein EP329_01455 [Deltaproteobacteria bacterium]|nr:MAG: hypothetical protein EP329_01455 [Deltaproteobacteria bacterium]